MKKPSSSPQLADGGAAIYSNDQLRPILEALQSVKSGDFSVRLPEYEDGALSQIHQAFNEVIALNEATAQEVIRIGRLVGREGRMTERASIPGAEGTWQVKVDGINQLIEDLARPTTEVARVITAVAQGDLTQKMALEIQGTPVKGEFLRIGQTVNTMVDQLGAFADEVTRVAREVGTEGKLGGQAKVPGVSGTWKDLTDSVNGLASNLTDQVRNIAKVTTAVAMGDLSQKITVEARGEVAELANTINRMVDQLNSFAAEVTRVAREVGTEGILGGQAKMLDVSGTWRDLTDSVNGLASNLTDQVRNIAKVTTAVAMGDLSQKITVQAQGEVLELKSTINTMVDQLNSFADEVTRVAKEVGTEGKLGGQAKVQGVSGTWKDLTDNVNVLAGNLTDQVRNIAKVTTAVAMGDLSQKITVEARGEVLELKNTINTMVDQLNAFAAEVTRVAKEVGTDGILGGQARVPGISGIWKDLTDNVNFMATNLTTQVRGIVRVVTAVANGDLNQKLIVEAKGEVAALAETINSMTETLSKFAEQVTTVAREVGTEGILGGQAKVPGVAGTWKDLTDSVNVMASNLTTQVRSVAKVVTAVANGDLNQKLIVEAKGEIAELADTINSMTETLSIFADQVTTVAREVGTEGKLGGQAKVPNVAGTWKNLTDNVNFMANSLTVQVRAIQDVATAVAQGDLTRTVTVDAQGEVQALKDNINQMIFNLRSTTEQNREQDWLKTNLANFSRIMQGSKSLESVSRLIINELTPLVSAHHGVFFIGDGSGNELVLKLLSAYGYRERKHVSSRFHLGESLVGQCALERKSILLTNVPGDYIQISSGLGEAPPQNIIVLPVLFEGEVLAVIELASFERFSQIHRTFLDQLMESIGVVLNMIQANMRTEELLKQSQSLTQELQSQSQELQSQQNQLKQTNVELENQAKQLEEKASELAEQNRAVEMKNREVELARAALEEKAEQLSLTSRYKSEFLANMSHELRTPLNSMLILAKLLSDNADGNLTPKQTEFAETIYQSGGELLNLINEILDLSKIEAGKMEVDVTTVPLMEVQDYADRTFRHMARDKGLQFHSVLDPSAPAYVSTDMGRLQQVLRNLIGNALKFTHEGSIELNIGTSDRDIVLDTGQLCNAGQLVAFRVIDTGVGIPQEKQKLIFEAFQQADGTTSRKYGGTGLGLSISREITKLLGGKLTVESELGAGSTFTLYLPATQKTDLPKAVAEAPAPHFVQAPTNGKPQTVAGFSDDREQVRPGDRVLLVVEDDETFSNILAVLARKQGFKVLAANDGETGLALAQRYRPDAITLDIMLPDIDGWKVLDELKRNPATRHIPVQVVSVVDRNRTASVGAISYLEKPVTTDAINGALTHIKEFIARDVKELLVVEDDEVTRLSVSEMLAETDVNVTSVSTGEEAIQALTDRDFDCVVLDLTLPDMGGLDVLRRVKRQERLKNLPVVIYTGKDLSKQESAQLKRYATAIITKDATSGDRLLDQTSLFLHRVVDKMPLAERESMERRGSIDLPQPRPNALETKSEGPLTGFRILVVDDDVRNIFALTSMLETNGADVLFEENGRDALNVLERNPEIDGILLDVMMPEMDGYETTKRIRQIEYLKNLPIIALTAKAMEGDREKCLAAGANDYITKPVDPKALLEMLNKWLGARKATLL